MTVLGVLSGDPRVPIGMNLLDQPMLGAYLLLLASALRYDPGGTGMAIVLFITVWAVHRIVVLRPFQTSPTIWAELAREEDVDRFQH